MILGILGEEHDADQQIAQVASERISQHMGQETALLYSVAQSIERIGLSSWQKETVLKNHVIRFPALESLCLISSNGKLLVQTSIAEKSFRSES